MDASDKAKGLVYAAVNIIVALLFFAPLAEASDGLAREFYAHCDLNSESALVLFVPGGDTIPAGLSPRAGAVTYTTTAPAGGLVFPITKGKGTACNVKASIVGASGAIFNAQTESGSTVQVTIPTGSTLTLLDGVIATTNEWQPVDAALTRFSSINRLLASLLLLLITTSYLAIAALGAVNVSRGQEMMKSAITGEVIILVGALVGVALVPEIFGAIVDANDVSESGRLTVTARFGNITGLIFSILPILLTLSVMALVAIRGVGAYKTFSDGGGFKGMKQGGM